MTITILDEHQQRKARDPNTTRGYFVVSQQTKKLFHFNNAAARAKHHADGGEVFRNSEQTTAAVKLGQVQPNLVQAVTNKRAVFTDVPPPREPRSARTIPLVLGRKRTPEEFASHAVDMASINPAGFRRPSEKASKPYSTSLVELAAIAAKQMEPTVFSYTADESKRVRSKRGQKRYEAKLSLRASILSERAGFVVDFTGSPVLDENGQKTACVIDPKYLSSHQRRTLARKAETELKEAA